MYFSPPALAAAATPKCDTECFKRHNQPAMNADARKSFSEQNNTGKRMRTTPDHREHERRNNNERPMCNEHMRTTETSGTRSRRAGNFKWYQPGEMGHVTTLRDACKTAITCTDLHSLTNTWNMEMTASLACGPRGSGRNGAACMGRSHFHTTPLQNSETMILLP